MLGGRRQNGECYEDREAVGAVPIRWHCDRIAAVVQAADGRVFGVAVRDAEPL